MPLRPLAGGTKDDPYDPIERVHSPVRNTIRNKGHFPSDDAATKLRYLALRQVEAKWKHRPREWHAAQSQLAIQFGERITLER